MSLLSEIDESSGIIRGVMTFPPLIFLVGPSGVGKSTIAKRLEADLRLLHLDLDQRCGFKANELQNELHLFLSKLDPAPLVSAIRARVVASGHSGALLSFPSNRVLTLNKIAAARSAGIHTVVLWGPEELCKKAACERPNGPVSEKRYDRSNRDAFDTYGGSEFADLRTEAFRLAGGRRDTEEIVEIIRTRVFGDLTDVGDEYPES